MEKSEEIIKRIKELRDKNPDFAKSIEKAFPEVIDETPYILNGDLFMRGNNNVGLFQLVLDKHNYFHIVNLKHQKSWSHNIKPTNYKDFLASHQAFLSKNDFSTLLSRSGIKLNSIRKVEWQHYSQLHAELFKNC